MFNEHEKLLQSMDKETITALQEHYLKEATKKGLPGAVPAGAPVPAAARKPKIDDELSALSKPLAGSTRAKRSSLF